MKEVDASSTARPKEKVKFVELGGVYFLKVRVKAEPSTLGFARPVR